MKRNRTGIVMIVLIILISSKIYGQIEKFQTAYMYNITKFIEWPSEADAVEFKIGVLGSNADIIPALNAMAGSKTIFNKPIKVLVFNSVSDISDCHILFIPSSENIATAVSKIAGKSMLVVSDHNNGISNGAAINFISAGNKLQFELKAANATKRGLKVNSALEGLAVKVY